ncbi:glycosyltransferase family 1 protein [Sulfitobacter sp. SK012]|nr:glycosyltransferase family 1 protein [Sulfitobacter sp. SK012]
MDRVEAAYLKALIADPVPVFGLIRTSLGYLLLDPAVLTIFAQQLRGVSPFPPTGILSGMHRNVTTEVRQALSSARRLAIGRVAPWGLPKLLERHLPPGFAYLNVGHSNLTDRVFRAVKSVSGAHISVLIHDAIPLDFPQFQRPNTVRPFEEKLRRAQAHADLIIYNSADTKRRAEAHMQSWGTVPNGVVAHLGTTISEPDASKLPPGLSPTEPYFVTVGTIEPRKNHAFLLDLWAQMGPAAPLLLICGNRGWNNREVFDQLDGLSATSRVKEVNDLSDAALSRLVAGAQGLLFPSHAEGFGLPAIEALTLGTPVFCNDIETFREILGEKAVYATVSDSYLWLSTIEAWTTRSHAKREKIRFDAPKWDDHFKTVLRLT